MMSYTLSARRLTFEPSTATSNGRLRRLYSLQLPWEYRNLRVSQSLRRLVDAAVVDELISFGALDSGNWTRNVMLRTPSTEVLIGAREHAPLESRIMVTMPERGDGMGTLLYYAFMLERSSRVRCTAVNRLLEGKRAFWVGR